MWSGGGDERARSAGGAERSAGGRVRSQARPSGAWWADRNDFRWGGRTVDEPNGAAGEKIDQPGSRGGGEGTGGGGHRRSGRQGGGRGVGRVGRWRGSCKAFWVNLM